MGEATVNGSGLAERLRQGDRTAFKELFHAHYQALCSYACRYVNSLEVAEDLVQEVFLDLWQRRHSWHPEHSPRAFLYGAVRNQTLNHQRRLRARQHVGRNGKGQSVFYEPPSQENPEETLRYQELRRAAQRAISELPQRRRQIFILSREHSLTYVEIAIALDISVKTVETQMGRALQHLRDRLSSQESSLQI